MRRHLPLCARDWASATRIVPRESTMCSAIEVVRKPSGLASSSRVVAIPDLKSTLGEEPPASGLDAIGADVVCSPTVRPDRVVVVRHT